MREFQQPNGLTQNDGLTPIQFLVLLSAVFVGAYARFRNLDFAAIALDEFHSVYAVQLILESGIPKFETGGFYVRGVLVNYLVAGLASIAETDPLILFRIVTASASAFSLIGVFLLGRTLFGNSVATGSVVVLSLSLLDIDTARYARMYAPLHCLAVFYFYHYVQFIRTAENSRAFAGLLTLSGISLFVGEAGALLAVLNILAIFLAPSVISRGRTTGVLLILMLAGGLRTIKWRDALALNAHPAGYAPAPSGSADAAIGPFLLPYSSIPALALLLLATVATFGALLSLNKKNPGKSHRPILANGFLALALAAAGAGLFALSASCFFAGLCFDAGVLSRHRRSVVLAYLGALSIAAIAWLLFSLVNYGAGAELLGALKETFWARLGYPPIMQSIVLPWLRDLPRSSILLATGVICLMVHYATSGGFKSPQTQVVLCFLGSLVSIALVIAAIDTPYRQVRYSQFLYPGAVTLALGGFFGLVRQVRLPNSWSGAVKLVTLGVFLLISDDSQVSYYPSVGTYETTYRLSPGLDMMRNRVDYKGPADFLNGLPPSDVVLTTVRQVDYHSDALDGVVMLQTDQRFHISSAAAGTRELWTNLPLISTLDDLLVRICAAGTTVHLLYPDSQYEFQNDLERYLAELPGRIEFRSDDRRLVVKQVRANDLKALCADSPSFGSGRH